MIIDWTREPLSEREANIRARLIQRRLSGPLERVGLRLTAMSLPSVASDLAEAVETASVLRWRFDTSA